MTSDCFQDFDFLQDPTQRARFLSNVLVAFEFVLVSFSLVLKDHANSGLDAHASRGGDLDEGPSGSSAWLAQHYRIGEWS